MYEHIPNLLLFDLALGCIVQILEGTPAAIGKIRTGGWGIMGTLFQNFFNDGFCIMGFAFDDFYPE